MRQIESLRPAATLIRCHHEQFNGGGFPDGVDGRQMPLSAKIPAGAVLYDDLVQEWNIPLPDMAERLQNMRGYELDPDIVNCLLRINLEEIRKDGQNELEALVLKALREGMRLARDIRRDNGALVMPAQTTLDPYKIEKLNKFGDLHCIANRAYVYRSSRGE